MSFRTHPCMTPGPESTPRGGGCIRLDTLPPPFARTIVFIRRMYVTMTLQDYFPADLTLLGLRNLFSEVGENSFYVQSGCIISKDKILTKGKHYIIFDIPTKSDIKMTEVILIDLFYYEGNIHLIVQDINTHRVSKVRFSLGCPETNCTRFLVDVNYFTDRVDDWVIRDYCGCGTNKKQPNGKCKTKAADDLLEFEF